MRPTRLCALGVVVAATSWLGWAATARAQPAEPPEPGGDEAPEAVGDGGGGGGGAPGTDGDVGPDGGDGAEAEPDVFAAGEEFEEDEAPTVELKYGARVQSDIRFRIEDKSVGNYYDHQSLTEGVERNQNLIGGKLEVQYGKVSAVIDADLILEGYRAEVDSFQAITRPDAVDPFRIDVRQAYLQVRDFIFDGLDLRLGQQIISWGVGDQFNPTNNLNSENLEDPLQFGKQLGNVMVRLDYWFTPEWSHSLVVVPIFKPAVLPTSAVLGAAATDRIPLEDAFLRHRLESEQVAAAGPLIGHPTIVGSLTPEEPAKKFDNIQVGYRLAGTLGGQDVALSYYLGRTDIPVPRANHTHQQKSVVCNPENPTECTQGLLVTDVTLHYPRLHAYGFNMAGEIPLTEEARAIGYRLEAALMVPERSTLRITQDALDLTIPQPAGEYDYDDDGRPGGPEPVVIDRTPFLKWTLGLDYGTSVTGLDFMVIGQWVHGFVDELGAGDFIHPGEVVRESGATTDGLITALTCALPRDGTKCAREITRPRLGDYLVVGFDFKFLEQHALARIFTIFDLAGYTEEIYDPAVADRVRTHYSLFSKEGFSAVIYPSFAYNFGNGLELTAGLLAQLGKSYTKFGDPANGGSVAFMRGSFAF